MRKIGRDYVLEHLKAAWPRPMTTNQLIRCSGRTPATINSATADLVRQGLIARLKIGKFCFKPAVPAKEAANEQGPLFEAERPVSQPSADSRAVVPVSFEGHEFRTVEIGGERWWALADVCKANDIGNAPDVASRLDDDEKDAIVLSDSIGRPQRMTIVNEGGLYNALRKSDKPFAKRFWRWVCHDVIPSIRKTGSYATTNVAPVADGTAIAAAVASALAPVLEHQASMMIEGFERLGALLVRQGQPPAPPPAQAFTDNVKPLNPGLFTQTIGGIPMAHPHMVKRQKAASIRLAELMHLPIGEGGFTITRLAKALQWMGAIRDFDYAYHEGERVKIPVPAPGYEGWFRMTITTVDSGLGPRAQWSWALTDEAMRELERLHREIKNWFEETA
jgi:prophage antirepressor-like protein